jgi:hypothetical protein
MNELKEENIFVDCQCPECRDAKSKLFLVNIYQVLNVCGENYSVNGNILKCSVCGQEFETPQTTDFVAKAYHRYRYKHNYIQPEEIIAFRNNHNLSYDEMSNLLKWKSPLTLVRIEHGALQTEDQNNDLKIFMRQYKKNFQA